MPAPAAPPPLLAALAALAALLGAALPGAAGEQQLWECAPCSAERLAACPPVPASCRERARPYGCGCCAACALRRGDACGFTSARCEAGLRCRARPGETRPLRALARGRGVCMPEAPVSEPSAEAAEAEKESPGSLSTVWDVVRVYKDMQQLQISDIQDSKDPCRRELHAALAKAAEEKAKAGGGLYSFYLPNCHQDGLYHSKQCMATLHGELGLCWCVYPWNGQRITGSAEVQGDPNCEQYFQGPPPSMGR
ncbi:insulin-like growth factor-binding protein 1 [Pipistrellus kuhlii]|uniref:insulin-like growth factor-binding protein 1 n=1 Tax=Pipistrellus kuhlii TaxID=59472 RepID=UPI001E2716C1|nr:insulin-like growth factor-binding protein 1 [Pipistrellus kuhlii]